MVPSEKNTGKIFEHFLSRFLAEILTPLVTMTINWPKPPYAQRHFVQLWADFQELGQYFLALVTLN